MRKKERKLKRLGVQERSDSNIVEKKIWLLISIISNLSNFVPSLYLNLFIYSFIISLKNKQDE